MRSTPPRLPIWPDSVRRTSYQVGRPWMFEGKMLRVATGTPMRRIDLAKSVFALAEPEPFTLANLTTKSFVLLIGFDMLARPRSYPGEISACPTRRWDSVRRRVRNGGRHLRPSP